MRDLFGFEVASNIFLCCFQIVFAPYSGEIESALLGRRLAALGEVPRILPRFSRVAGAIDSGLPVMHELMFRCLVSIVAVEQTGGSV